MNHPEEIKKHFDLLASQYDYWKSRNYYYYELLKGFYKKNIPVGSSVVEFGCGTAEIMASCKPKRGLGIDFSEDIIAIARRKYPEYELKVADALDFKTEEKFDYCIMSDIIDHLTDIPKAIESAYSALNPDGKLIITTINPLWNPVFNILERLKLKMPEGPHCFVPNRYIEFICKIKGFKLGSRGALIFIPKRITFLSDLLNSIMPIFPLLHRFCWVQTLVMQKDDVPKKKMDYTVIIPTYNEENNIEECISRIPNADTEIIVVDDGSIDGTKEVLGRLKKQFDNLKAISFSQNKGKASAVEEGIRQATKEAIVILDADMAVAPEDMPLFIEPLERNIADFVNGTRLIYNAEKDSMNQLKKIGNFFFALLFSAILRFRVTDALCGTKSFLRDDFKGVKMSGERWGDFVLLWNARKKKLRMGELPVHYYRRKSGESKMNPLLDGLRFLNYVLMMSIKKLFGR